MKHRHDDAAAPILVFGWGNPSRGDDALGPLCVAALRAQLPLALCAQVEFLEDYQLQIEHALDLIGRQHILLIDAGLACVAPFEATSLQARHDASLSTHALSPAALLQVYQALQREPAPPCTLLAIRGEKFVLGEAPSPAALTNLQHALQWAWLWLAQSANFPAASMTGLNLAISAATNARCPDGSRR